MKTIRIRNSQDSRGLPDAGAKSFHDGDPCPSSSDPVIPSLSSQEDIYRMDRANTGTIEDLIESTIDDTFSDYVHLSNRKDDNRKSIKLHDIQDSASQSDDNENAKYAVKRDHKNSNFSENMIMEKSQTSHVIGGASLSDRKITDRDCHSTPTTTNQIPQEAHTGVDSVEKAKFGLNKHEVGSMVLALDVSSPVSFVDTPMMSKVSCYILMHFKPYPKLNQLFYVTKQDTHSSFRQIYRQQSLGAFLTSTRCGKLWLINYFRLSSHPRWERANLHGCAHVCFLPNSTKKPGLWLQVPRPSLSLFAAERKRDRKKRFIGARTQ